MASDRRLWAALFVLSWAVATPALAEPTFSERETARSLMVEGDRLRTAGDVAGALERYRSAHAIMHVPSTGFALASAHAQLGQLVEARSAAVEVVNLAESEAEPPAFVAARKAAAQLARKLEPRVPALRATVTPASANYTLQIDEVVLPQAARDVPYKTNPGAHTVRVEAPGFAAQTRRVQLAEGDTEALSIALVPLAEMPAQTKAADVPAPGPPDVEDPATPGRVRGNLGLSVGGLALVAGVTAGTVSWVATHDEKPHCASDGLCAESRASALSRANTLANVANIAVPLGILGIAYGMYELLTLPDSRPASAQARVRLDVTPHGILLRGAL